MNCVVFGGSRGIGRAITDVLVNNNCRVAVVSRGVTPTDENLLKTYDGVQHTFGFSCDVTEACGVEKTIQQIHKTFGHIDVLINAAGINHDGLLIKAAEKDIHDQINTNLLGTINTCKAVLKPMMQNKKGSIINIGSIVGELGNAGQTVYSATKSGLVGFTKSLAKEVASRGITVNLVAPGFIDTDMTKNIARQRLMQAIPLGRLGQPQEVAETCYFIISSRYITGQVFFVDGGLHINM